MDKLDALCDVALEAGDARLEQLLLVCAELAEDVVGLFSTFGLCRRQQQVHRHGCEGKLTPSSTGTEK